MSRYTGPSLGGGILLLLSGTALGGPSLPWENDAMHVGVATCASSDCHAASEPMTFASVQQQEYFIWRDHDAHSGAFASLEGARAQRIAAALGIDDPTRSGQCLDCHTDHVPPDRRDEDFSLADGVGCEACHGGAERWLGSHSSGTATRAENLAAGMYPTDDPATRAELCLSCHLGREDLPMRHRLHGAGHPRLTFELDTYSEVRPAHHQVDQGYLQRKSHSYGARAWAIGQVATAQRRIELLVRHPDGDSGLYPEFGHFECHSCHRRTSDGAEIPRSSPRTNDAALEMSMVVARVFATELEEPLRAGIDRLQQATEQDRQAWLQAADELRPVLVRLDEALAEAPSDVETTARLLGDLTRRAGAGHWISPAQAEQATYAAATLLTALERRGGQVADPAAADAALNAMYDVADRPAAFDATAWREAARALDGAVRE